MIFFNNLLVTVLYNMNDDIDLVGNILTESCLSQNMYDECQEVMRKKELKITPRECAWWKNKFKDNTERRCLVEERMANCFALLRPPMLQNQNDKGPRQRERSRPGIEKLRKIKKKVRYRPEPIEIIHNSQGGLALLDNASA